MQSEIDKISEAESEIMRVVWEHDGPVTYAHIRSVLTKQQGWESPTVNTLVNRLVKKGILIQEKKEVYILYGSCHRGGIHTGENKRIRQKVYGGNVKGLMSALLSYEGVTQADWIFYICKDRQKGQQTGDGRKDG